MRYSLPSPTWRTAVCASAVQHEHVNAYSYSPFTLSAHTVARATVPLRAPLHDPGWGWPTPNSDTACSILLQAWGYWYLAGICGRCPSGSWSVVFVF